MILTENGAKKAANIQNKLWMSFKKPAKLPLQIKEIKWKLV